MSIELDHKLISNDFDNNGLVDFATNGHANDSSSSSAGDETATTTSTATVPDPNNYDTIFPSLTSSGVNMAVSDAWNKHDTSKLALKHQHTTQIFHVPVEERRYRDVSNAGFGNSSNSNETKKKCEDIANRFGVKVEMCCSKDLDLHIVISGLEEKVVDAKKSIIAELQTERDRKIKIPKEHHKFLIGRGGSVLKQIQDQTCTTIQIPKSDTGSDIITITGPKDGIDNAINEIQFICDEQSKSGFERLAIPKLYHPWIRGCNNEVMNEISQRTGAKINIPPPQIEKDEIAVSGEKERVELACAEIQRIYASKLKLNITKLEIEITKSQHKLIIGRNGSTVQDIFREYDVYVQVPKSSDDSETIYLYGEESKLGAALAQVCAKANSVMNAEIEAPSWLHRYMIGEKGANISKITADYPNTHVKFEADNRITLDGPPEEVERVRERLQNITIGLKQNMVCEELIVDTKYHSQLVGKKYENVNRINKEYGVLVRVPDAPSSTSNNSNIKNSIASNVIRIEGAPDSVARAKADLTELIKRLENERSKDIIIEQKYHATLIGKNGKNLNEIRAKFNNIQINIPTVEEKSDIVTIRGNKFDVEKCFQHLNKTVKEMQENNYQEDIHIYKEFHRLIIGKQGAFIRKIKDETQTRIDVPSEDSDSDKVIITGKQENVMKARKMIEDKVKELLKIEEDHVDIPHNLHTALIGKGGIIIKQIRRECGNVLINFPAENLSMVDKVTLKGPREDIAKAKEELLKLAKEKNDMSHSDEINTKLEYHKFLVGKKGNHINSLKDKYNVRIIFPSSSSSSSSSYNNNNDSSASQKDNNNNSGNHAITIIGKEDSVKSAKAELEATIKLLDEQIIDHVSVDPKWHKIFTSRRGKLINKISDDNCNVNISFPKLIQTTDNQIVGNNQQQQVSDSVTLKGPRDAVDAAKKKILEVVHELDNQVTIDVNVPQKYHVSIIGKKGANSQQISDDYKVEIHFPAKSSFNDATRRSDNRQQRNNNKNTSTSPTATTTNEDDNENLTNGASNGTNSPSSSSTNDLTNGTEQSSPSSSSSTCDIIQITGLLENCEKAKEAILEMLPVSEDVPFPNTFHRDLLSNKAEALRLLTDNHNVQINVPKRNDENNDYLNVVGTKDNIASAKLAIAECLTEFERKNFRVEIVDFNPDFIPQMRGRNGKEIQALEKKYNVRIDMSRKGEDDKIVIKGVQEDVKKCEDYIREKIRLEESKVSTEIEIDSRVHSRIIGSMGKSLAKITDKYKVDIKFAGRGSTAPSDIVTVRGEENAVDECCDHLKNLEEEYLQDVSDSREYMHPSKIAENNTSTGSSNGSAGFIVRGAPWEASKNGMSADAPAPDTNNLDLFPTMTSAMSGTDTNGNKSSWGPSRK